MRSHVWGRVASPIILLGILIGNLVFLRSPTVMAQIVALSGQKLTPLKLGQVQVGGEFARRIDITTNNNLLVLDCEQEFLQPFRAKDRRDGYIGLGKLIDSAVRLAADTDKQEVLAFKDHLVAETIKCQLPDGYIGMLEPSSRMTGMWDIAEMSYVMYGLISDYRFFDNQASLQAAQRLADYVISNWEVLPDNWQEEVDVATDVAVVGLEESLLCLYEDTGEQRYLDFCLQQRALPEWDLGIVIGRRALIKGHVYGYFARCMAQLELDGLQPDRSLLAQTERGVDFLTHKNGATITGASGQWEIWTDDQDGRCSLGETCATTYEIRVYESLLQLEGRSTYGDLMERTIYNSLFAAQSPDGRQIRYYTPFEGDRVYYPDDTYCCPGNYRRIVADLPSFVYYRSDSGVTVNLYTTSTAQLKLKGQCGLTISQETDYPSSGRVTITVTPDVPVEFPVALRIPAWCQSAKIKVNSDPPLKVPSGSSFFTVDRLWQPGDQIVLDMPMPWRFVRGRRRQAGRIAVMRGPVVFCLNPQQNPELATWDGADLGRIVILPETTEEPVPDASVRPQGVACRIRAFTPGYAVKDPDLTLLLTEFADPAGKAIYFRTPDLSVAVDDELFCSDAASAAGR